MKKTKRKHADDLRAIGKLAVFATRGVTDVVEEMHQTIASGPWILGRPLARPVRAFTGVVYGTIRGVTQVVGVGVDTALSRLGPLLGESEPGPEREALLAVLNGVSGDHLERIGSPLAIAMSFRHRGISVPLDARALREFFPRASRKLLVLIHGSSMNDLQFCQKGHDHGAELAAELGYTPVYLHYNTGLHISTNGKALARLLETLVGAWPVPIDAIGVVTHSMGGLVARSACHAAEVEGFAWRRKLRKLVFLGTPHHGSPIERVGNWIGVLLGISAYSAPIGRLARIRSAGITDMRFGNILDADWEGGDRFSRAGDARHELTLPAGVDCYAIAATTATAMKEKLPGDGLVSVDSALGRHRRRDLTLAFPPAHQWIALGTGHVALLGRREVYEQLRAWFSSDRSATPLR